ncbi:MAG TPA: hypothetical protein VK973_13960 [Arenicellales bacterium]|nr:hypothetical protein [Arenicellales bacterium]
MVKDRRLVDAALDAMMRKPVKGLSQAMNEAEAAHRRYEEAIQNLASFEALHPWLKEKEGYTNGLGKSALL